MVSRGKGRPALVVALPQDVIEELKALGEERFGPRKPGQSGGASRLVREWIFEKLGRPAPDEWGEYQTPIATYQRERRARRAAEEAAREEPAEEPEP